MKKSIVVILGVNRPLVYDAQFFLCSHYKFSKCVMPSIFKSVKILKVVWCIPAFNPCAALDF